jgi:hypothetical protein
MEFKTWLEDNTDYFKTGTFSYEDGTEFPVEKIINALQKANYPITNVNIRRLIPDQFNGNMQAVEPVGSPDWAARANRAEMKYPILVIRSPGGGLWVGDGNHRLWRAYQAGQRQIKAYVVDEKNLPSLIA